MNATAFRVLGLYSSPTEGRANFSRLLGSLNIGWPKNMPFLVTLTFDLRSAEPQVYPRIAADLQKIDLAKVIMLPNNKKSGSHSFRPSPKCSRTLCIPNRAWGCTVRWPVQNRVAHFPIRAYQILYRFEIFANLNQF